MKIFRMLGLCLLLAAAGCLGEAAPPAEVSEAEAEALAVLRASRQDALRTAFAGLAEARYTRYIRTTQLDAAGRIVAVRAYTRRFDEAAGPRVVIDSAGAFDFGYVEALASAEADADRRDDLSAYLLPEDPAYLAPRSREAFRYRLLPDTMLWGRATRRVEVEARPGSDQPIRAVRLYVDAATDEVVALALRRRSDALFFREESRLYAALRLAPGGTWHPFLTRFDTRLRLPFRPPQHLRTVAAYYLFRG